MHTRDLLAELGSVVASYLSALTSVAECLAEASPEVGPPYRDKLKRVRARLSFEATAQSVHASVATLEAELADYAGSAVRYHERHAIELRTAILLLENIVESMARNSRLHNSRLELLAQQMETAAVADPARHAGRLRQCIQSMGDDVQQMVANMQQEINAVEARIEGSHSTDSSTGLLNRREMARQIEAFRLSGCTFSLLRFELRGAIGEPVMQQAAHRLTGSFRNRERIARWGQAEFLVLFQGSAELARTRAALVAPSLQRYSLGAGARVEASVRVEVTEQELPNGSTAASLGELLHSLESECSLAVAL